MVYARVEGNIKLLVEFSVSRDELQTNIEGAFTRIHQRLFLQPFVLRIEHTTLLLRKDGDIKSMNCSKVFKQVENHIELPGISKRRKRLDLPRYIPITMLLPMSQKHQDKELPVSMVISQSRKEFLCSEVTLHVDLLITMSEEDAIQELYKTCVQKLREQLDDMQSCMLKWAEDHGEIAEPVVLLFHVKDLDDGAFVFAVMPAHATENQLKERRRELHLKYKLQIDRPHFRFSNKYVFAQDRSKNAPLINPHISCSPPQVEDGETALVKGDYVYHHYMQDRIDDNGWGCAYRSLQTLCSWYQQQGYTSDPPPSHKHIQQILVDIRDKEAKFVGSRQWIGSSEVGLCLQQLLKVDYKILFVNSGSEVASKARELLHHFAVNGTPVMIGGGVLAHTILGVSFNSSSGDIKFLILDPHYTGGENIDIIIDKGWCGWKGADFWDPNAYYNMCLPQLPDEF